MIDRLNDDLLKLILIQQKEIERLRLKLDQVKQYIEVYEEYIKGE